MHKFALVAWQRLGVEMATAGTALVLSPLIRARNRVSMSGLDVSLDSRLVRGALRALTLGIAYEKWVRKNDWSE